ncbi:TauD/TfdA dioxygenase family protein [Caballeronia udeis]|uniref:TauD/TfdA dioxygenase family protein n=1 Tax=Caballeronia udeis TaxID=1232866 RepID=UPI000785FA09|nr:TauD/TfdA family dioxygenase [Caballeronia udeis]
MLRDNNATYTADQVVVGTGLWELATNERYVWSQEWKPGDMVIWDNRCSMHRRDPFDPSTVRRMHRTTVESERPQAA